MASFFNIDDMYKIYDIDISLKSEGIAIVDQSYYEMDELEDYRHQFDGLLISFMVEGSMQARIHFQEYTIEKGDVLVVLPQLMIEPLRATKDAKMITTALSMDFLSTYPILRQFITDDKIRWKPIVANSSEEQNLYKEQILLLQKFFLKKASPQKSKILQYLIFALISSLSETYSSLAETKNLERDRKHEIIDKFYVLISQYASKQRKVKFYADKLHLTPQYLTSLLKAETGKSITQWLDHVVVMHAKSLLRSTNMTIKEISSELNFGDTSLFCRYFKRNTNLSPKSFRDDLNKI